MKFPFSLWYVHYAAVCLLPENKKAIIFLGVYLCYNMTRYIFFHISTYLIKWQKELECQL